MLKARLKSSVTDSSAPPPAGGPAYANRELKFTPQRWDAYFDSRLDVTLSDGNPEERFRVYLRKAESPDAPLFVLHHGGGHSALSWALLANVLWEESRKGASLLCFDCRGHGDTHADDPDFSLIRLSRDMAGVVREVFKDQSMPKEIVLVGHSMGGPVAVEVARQELLPNLIGIVVVDVVEGTALQALSGMQDFLSKRPKVFPSVEACVEWSIKSHAIRNVESARVSVPSQLRQHGDQYEWRTDLSLTEPFWQEWFENLSSKFLSCKCSRLLVLAGVDRLDRELTIGQMQGKFQMVVFPNAGHAVMEDDPVGMANALWTFAGRNRRGGAAIKRFPIPLKPK